MPDLFYLKQPPDSANYGKRGQTLGLVNQENPFFPLLPIDRKRFSSLHGLGTYCLEQERQQGVAHRIKALPFHAKPAGIPMAATAKLGSDKRNVTLPFGAQTYRNNVLVDFFEKDRNTHRPHSTRKINKIFGILHGGEGPFQHLLGHSDDG